ncbi:MAG: response regulator [Magnetococcales bacterium]|nr:response regulator [Magnetococcales bacterium]
MSQPEKPLIPSWAERCRVPCRFITTVLLLALLHAGLMLLTQSFATPPSRLTSIALHLLVIGLGGLPVIYYFLYRPLDLHRSRQDWILKSAAQLNSRMRGLTDTDALCHTALGFLANHLKAQNGAIHLMETDGLLHLTAGFALSPEQAGRKTFQLGEGLIGQAALEKKIFHLADIPTDSLTSFTIEAGTVAVAPTDVLAIPMIHNDQLRGVLTLGAIHPFSELHQKLLERVSGTIAVAIGSVQAALRTQTLLDETQRQAQVLTIHQKVLDDTISQLEQTSGYKSRFLASMSHELRSPLNSLLILSKLLGDNKQGNLTDKQVEFAETIHAAGSDLLALIDEILDLARIEAGRVRIFKDDLKLTELAESLGKLFRHVAQDKGVLFEVNLKGMLPIALYTDRQRVEQILKNLLSNAIKFTEKGLIELTFQARKPDNLDPKIMAKAKDWLAISVTDTGIGIPEEKQALIFEPFRQVDDSTNRQYGGTGLGLAICRELATLLEGSITLKSQEGEGSVFTLYLPVTSAPVAVESEKSEGEDNIETSQTPQPRDKGLESIRDDRRTLGPADRSILVVGTDHERVRKQNEIARNLGLGVIVAGDQGAALFLANYYHPVAAIVVGELSGVDITGLVDRLRGAVRWDSLPLLHLAHPGFQTPKTAIKKAYRMVSLSSGSDICIQESTRFLKEVVDGIPGRKPKVQPSTAALTTDPTSLKKSPDKMPSARNLEGRRILLVEDNMRNIFALTSLLEDKQATILMAENGRIGLNRLEDETEEPVDMVLLDIMMPDMNGYEVLKEIRKNPKLQNLPVIVLTAKALHGERQRCLDAGASDYLPKPVDPPKLLSMIDIWLGEGG